MNTLLAALFTLNSQTLELPPHLLEALCYVESKHDITAVHKDDGKTSSLGVCQIKLATAKMMGFIGDEKQLMEPHTNILYASFYLKHQLTRYHNNVTKAVIAYNQGSAKQLTTTTYSARVLKQWREIKNNGDKCNGRYCIKR